ncbi:MAG: hypothetical protein H6738_07800 [Alphaproteobacteria bacterium]|nr:hypothetical protein [Alphaproteobacteria bacterium]MCB9696669.1 hypothetical protein [Alphaproteobacteria bacterium]
MDGNHPPARRGLPLGVRLFLAMGIPYGLVMGLLFASIGVFDAISSGGSLIAPAATGMGVGLGAGLFYGAVMALWATMFQATGMTRHGAQRMPTNSTVHQRWRLAVPADPVAVLAAARRVLEERGVAAVLEEGPDRLTVRTRVGMRSWGEIVSVEVQAAGSETLVEIASRPRLWTTMVDGGRNNDNVTAVADAVVDVEAVEEPQGGQAGGTRSRATGAARARDAQ